MLNDFKDEVKKDMKAEIKTLKLVLEMGIKSEYTRVSRWWPWTDIMHGIRNGRF